MYLDRHDRYTHSNPQLVWDFSIPDAILFARAFNISTLRRCLDISSVYVCGIIMPVFLSLLAIFLINLIKSDHPRNNRWYALRNQFRFVIHLSKDKILDTTFPKSGSHLDDCANDAKMTLLHMLIIAVIFFWNMNKIKYICSARA